MTVRTYERDGNNTPVVINGERKIVGIQYGVSPDDEGSILLTLPNGDDLEIPIATLHDWIWNQQVCRESGESDAPIDAWVAPPDPDDLDILRAEVEADPIAKAAYEDAKRRREERRP